MRRATASIPIPGSPGTGQTFKADPQARARLEPDQAAWLAQPASFSSFEPLRLENEVFRLTNEVRAANGRDGLNYLPALAEAAREYSLEMARLGRFSHESPTPGKRSAGDRLAAKGLDFEVSAENIAYEPCIARLWNDGRAEPFTWGQLAENAIQHWMKSSGHRTNILRREVTELGVGAAIAGLEGQPYIYLTQNFRKP